MSYEQYCNDYAVHGDPERDHYDYEEAAMWDRFDGFDVPDDMDRWMDSRGGDDPVDFDDTDLVEIDLVDPDDWDDWDDVPF